MQRIRTSFVNIKKNIVCIIKPQQTWTSIRTPAATIQLHYYRIQNTIHHLSRIWPIEPLIILYAPGFNFIIPSFCELIIHLHNNNATFNRCRTLNCSANICRCTTGSSSSVYGFESWETKRNI